MNFGLCRILIAIINGNVAKSAMSLAVVPERRLLGPEHDQHVQGDTCRPKVFHPSGVANADFEPLIATPDALAYPFPFGSTPGGTRAI